jgi:hypothetical protein
MKPFFEACTSKNDSMPIYIINKEVLGIIIIIV